MKTLTFKSGRKINCDGATAGRKYSNYLHIHTNALSYVEAAQLFSDPLETTVLTYAEDETIYTFDGYVKLLGIGADPLIQEENELLIRLSKEEAST